MQNSLNLLERAVLEKLLVGEHPILAALRKQLESADVESRELTGVGFFTEVKLLETDSRLPFSKIVFGDVEARIEGLKHGAGFLVFVENGLLQMLEGYTYDEPWPNEVGVFELNYYEQGRIKLLAQLDQWIKG